MDIFDEYIVGNLDNINWCFENTHFLQRLQDNGISREYIVDTILNEEPLRYEPNGNHQYEVIFPAPETKKYSEIKVIFACDNNTINLVTVMPNATTNRQKNTYKSTSYKNLEKKRLKAYSKRKKLYWKCVLTSVKPIKTLEKVLNESKK